MKNLLKISMTLAGIFLTMSLAFGQDAVPAPDVALTFEGTPGAYAPEVTDVSGNGNNALWYNYFISDGENPAAELYAGYFADSGKFGAAWYASGYHQSCCNMCSSAEDFILLAGNNSANDYEGFQGKSEVFHNGMSAMTVMFWFKSNRNYDDQTTTPCPKGVPLAMHEQELLFSHGTNGLAINNSIGFYEVKVAGHSMGLVWNGAAQAKYKWQHIAVTFDGSTGALTFYLDGELGSPAGGDPNPLMTALDSIVGSNSSTEIGAQNSGGLFGNVSAFWDAANEQCCVVPVLDPFIPKYRTGWPAGGYYDEFVFYRDVALTQEQIQCIMNNGIEQAMVSCTGNIGIKKLNKQTSKIYPNPASDMIRISLLDSNIEEMTIFNVVGAAVLQRVVENGDQVDISDLRQGVYFVKLGNQLNKLIIK